MGEEINAACEKCDSPISSDTDDDEHCENSDVLQTKSCGIIIKDCSVDGNSGCSHSPQCIIRQPYPPPLPSITHIRNNASKYHVYMLETSGVPGRFGGHDKCLNAYSKNYGCDACVWLKWYGELHGLPDIHPQDFRKYLDPD